MEIYKVEIVEMLRRTVEVEAASYDEAERIVSGRWRDSEYVLDADDFDGVEFRVGKGGELG